MALLVNAEDDLEAVGEVGSEAEAAAAARVLEPDIAPTVRRNGPSPYWAKNADGTPP